MSLAFVILGSLSCCTSFTFFFFFFLSFVHSFSWLKRKERDTKNAIEGFLFACQASSFTFFFALTVTSYDERKDITIRQLHGCSHNCTPTISISVLGSVWNLFFSYAHLYIVCCIDIDWLNENTNCSRINCKLFDKIVLQDWFTSGLVRLV